MLSDNLSHKCSAKLPVTMSCRDLCLCLLCIANTHTHTHTHTTAPVPFSPAEVPLAIPMPARGSIRRSSLGMPSESRQPTQPAGVWLSHHIISFRPPSPSQRSVANPHITHAEAKEERHEGCAHHPYKMHISEKHLTSLVMQTHNHQNCHHQQSQSCTESKHVRIRKSKPAHLKQLSSEDQEVLLGLSPSTCCTLSMERLSCGRQLVFANTGCWLRVMAVGLQGLHLHWYGVEQGEGVEKILTIFFVPAPLWGYPSKKKLAPPVGIFFRKEDLHVTFTVLHCAPYGKFASSGRE